MQFYIQLRSYITTSYAAIQIQTSANYKWNNVAVAMYGS